MVEMADGSKDDFMGDWEVDAAFGEFLSEDPNQVDAESTYVNSHDFFPLSATYADDESLCSYLSGEIFRPNDKDSASTVSNSTDNAGKERSFQISPQHYVTMSDNDGHEMDPSNSSLLKQMIVDSIPPQHVQAKVKGDSSSKQAIAARQNRLKKKQYVSGLENSVEKLSEENKTLKKQNSDQKQEIQMLQNEVSYLKRVIANDSALSSVLTTMLKNVNGDIKFSSSLSSYIDKTEQRTDYNGLPKAHLAVSLSDHTESRHSRIGQVISGQKSSLQYSSSGCADTENTADHLTLMTSTQAMPAKQTCHFKAETVENMKHLQFVNVSKELSVTDQFVMLNQTAKGYASSDITAGTSLSDEESSTKVDSDVADVGAVGMFDVSSSDLSSGVTLDGVCWHPEHMISNGLCSSCGLVVKVNVTDHAYVKTFTQ